MDRNKLRAVVEDKIRRGDAYNAISRELGVPRTTVRYWAQRLQPFADEINVTPAPDPNEPLEALIARKKAGMARSNAYEAWAKLIPVQVKTSGPIGLFLVGDPHVDDDHCDIAQLEHDLSTVGRTKAFFAGHVGDLTNNWVGRLKALYANQGTTFRDGLRLTEWMLGLAPNLFVVGGNHDCWEKGMDLLNFIVKQGPSGPLQAHGARLALNFPGGQEIRIHARHDFPGKSQFSDTHGMKRELLFGHKDHILVAGHTHVDEARIEPSIDGEVHWFFRVSGYKVIDDFAKEKGFRPKRLAPGVSVVIDPSRKIPAERVKPFWDVEAAADYLTFLRSKGASKGSK
jgi:hypothetical protein